MAQQHAAHRKRCRVCGRRRSVTMYHKNPKTPDGRNGKCKDCQNAYQREYYARHRAWVVEQKRAYRERNGTFVRERKREQYAKKQGYVRTP